MKTSLARLKSTSSILAATALAATVAQSSVIQRDYSFSGLNLDIPDGSLSGLVNRQSLDGPDGALIRSLEIELQLAGTGTDGAWNGDFYVTLQHDTGFAVLLNRVGRSISSPLGFSDNGLSIRLSDTGSDVHTYRDPSSAPLSSMLTGLWGTDGRAADPFHVLDTTPRSALLSSFNGLSLDGDWSLFVMDAESGATARLSSWGLSMILDLPENPANPGTHPATVPDSTPSAALVVFSFLGLLAMNSGIRKSKDDPGVHHRTV